nr:phage major capsid protein [Aureimonas ureilytica]
MSFPATIAHLFKASRQILDDAPALAGYIDARGRYGLALKEESQIFFGDGTGQNLYGLMPQARTYDTTRTATGDTELDILLHAISQVEEADLPATGIVLSVRDWRQLLGLKDLGKNYLSGGPFGTTEARIWDLPVYPTNTFATGQFLVGAFNSGGAQIFDRMEVEVLVSTENEDDFVKNMATIRIEERLAFATWRMHQEQSRHHRRRGYR